MRSPYGREIKTKLYRIKMFTMSSSNCFCGCSVTHILLLFAALSWFTTINAFVNLEPVCVEGISFSCYFAQYST